MYRFSLPNVIISKLPPAFKLKKSNQTQPFQRMLYINDTLKGHDLNNYAQADNKKYYLVINSACSRYWKTCARGYRNVVATIPVSHLFTLRLCASLCHNSFYFVLHVNFSYYVLKTWYSDMLTISTWFAYKLFSFCL